MKGHAKVVFTPSGKRGSFPFGTPLLDAARTLGVDIDSVCGGRGLCGRCQVSIALGVFSKHSIASKAENVSAPSRVERRFRERETLSDDTRRLSCQACIGGDLVVDVPAESQVHRQLVRKNVEHRDVILDTGIHLHYIELDPATLEDSLSDAERLVLGLERQWELSGLKVHPALLATLQPRLRKLDWVVTAAVLDQSQVVAIWPGFKRDAFGLAIDIGSTTIAAYMCNLTDGEVIATAGIMNPQIRFGEDLMSRVSYVQMHNDGAAALTAAVRRGINDLIAELSRNCGIDGDSILAASVAANPIMHHLFLGISPVELGAAPFSLATREALTLTAAELELNMAQTALVYVLPCIAGHVGADTAAMILAEAPQRRDDVSLLIDVGTNAEIVLSRQHRVFACSSPTGPAFEGAQISCGQRAAPGAIERVRIDRNSLDVRLRVIGSELWSDETGFDNAVAPFGVTGICGSGIIEAIAEMYLAGVITPDGVINGALAERCERVIPNDRTWSFVVYDGNRRILVTQNDVRQIQLAKAALYAGIKLLLDQAELSGVDRIRLAGAFGSHIDPAYAMILGLIPDCDLEHVSSAGNAAGTGALMALLSRGARHKIEGVVKQIRKIETAIEPRFQEYFIDAMTIPHKRDEFSKLFSRVQQPDALTTVVPVSPRSTRRRRRSK